ncbi:hypothetical protein [Paenibacillus sp. PL2-23]|uniref:hypothetical protein n=1 Tax=Paenibacillus sp. PL2-23 TaxID=2100729 RepID=UPI0030F7AEAC
MRTNLDQLLMATLRLVEQIETAETEELVGHVELRDSVIDQLRQAKVINDEEKQIIICIQKYDEIIISRMKLLMDEAALGLSKLGNSRIQKQIYEKAYASESYFIDYKE